MRVLKMEFIKAAFFGNGTVPIDRTSTNPLLTDR